MPDHALKIEPLRRSAIGRVPVQNQILRLARQLFEWRIEIESVRQGCQPQRALQICRARGGAKPPFEQRLRPIDNHLRRIEIVFRAETVAFRAGAVRRIETERTRLKLRNRNSTIRARQFFGIDVLFPAHHRDGDEAAGELQSGFDRLLQALRDAIFQQQPVDDHFDGVVFPPIKGHRLVNTHQVAIDARPHVALFRVLLELFLVFALAPADHRRQHHDAVLGFQRQHGLHDLLG